MTMIPFICLAVVCVALGAVKTIFNSLVGWKGILVRGLSIISILVFALVIANLEGISNALTLFVDIGFAVLLLAEVVYVSMEDDNKLKPVVNGVFLAISCVLFALSAVSLAEFSLLAFLGGLFAGVGVGLIVCAPKKNKGLNHVLMNVLTFACIGVFVGFGVSSVLLSKHLITSVCLLAGGVLLLVNRILIVTGNGKVAKKIAEALSALALIAISASIYFY